MDPELQRVLVYGVLGILGFVVVAYVIVWTTVGRIFWKNWKKFDKDF